MGRRHRPAVAPIFAIAAANWNGRLSPDKSTLAVACYDGAIRLLDANDGTLRDTLVAHAPGTLDIKLAFSADGGMLASGGRDNQVYVWELPMCKRCDVLRGHSLAIWSVAFTPGGDWLATASHDRTVRLWNVNWILCDVDSTFEGHTMYVTNLAFGCNGKWLASAAMDNTVRIWDIATGKTLHVLEGDTFPLNSLTTSPRDALVAGAYRDGRLTVWNAETGDTALEATRRGSSLAEGGILAEWTHPHES